MQIHADAQVVTGPLKGRVEHLVSHQAEHFDSLEELVAFMVQVVTNHKSHKKRGTRPRDRFLTEQQAPVPAHPPGDHGGRPSKEIHILVCFPSRGCLKREVGAKHSSTVFNGPGRLVTRMLRP